MTAQSLPTDDKGRLLQFAWPGGYEVIYGIGESTLCASCARNAMRDGERVEWYEIYYEGPTLECDDCGRDIASAYGDPEDKGDES